jgi:hypothetical protein
MIANFQSQMSEMNTIQEPEMINGDEMAGFNRMQTGLDGPDVIKVDDDNAKKELRL